MTQWQRTAYYVKCHICKSSRFTCHIWCTVKQLCRYPVTFFLLFFFLRIRVLLQTLMAYNSTMVTTIPKFTTEHKFPFKHVEDKSRKQLTNPDSSGKMPLTICQWVLKQLTFEPLIKQDTSREVSVRMQWLRLTGWLTSISSQNTSADSGSCM